jgi:hypothetical protein
MGASAFVARADHEVGGRGRARIRLPSAAGSPDGRTTCSSETPFNSVGLHDSRHLAAKMSLEGRAPWDQAESESVVDQCEAAGGQVQALPIDTRDPLALPCRMIRQAIVRSDARRHSLELASPKRVEEITCEYDALALPVGEALPDQALDASVHRLADLAAESARAKRGRFTSDELAVEPSGAASRDLRLDRQVGTHRQRDALAADGILKPAELDDAARPAGVARSVQVGQRNMMSTSASTPSITAYAVPLSSSSRPRATSRPMIGDVASPPSSAKSATLRSMP